MGSRVRILFFTNNVPISYQGAQVMIIDEDRFYKVAKQFLNMLKRLDRAAASGDAVHEVEEMTWFGLIEMGREMIVAHIKQQDEELPRPQVIEREGKPLRRLPKRRRRNYVSVFGPTPFQRDVYATRETQRQEVVPLDAKLGMPESDTSYLLQKWGCREVRERIVPGVAGRPAGDSRLRAVGQLPGGHGGPDVGTCRGLLRRTRAGRSNDGGRNIGRHERLQRRADAAR